MCVCVVTYHTPSCPPATPTAKPTEAIKLPMNINAGNTAGHVLRDGVTAKRMSMKISARIAGSHRIDI